MLPCRVDQVLPRTSLICLFGVLAEAYLQRCILHRITAHYITSYAFCDRTVAEKHVIEKGKPPPNCHVRDKVTAY